MTIFADPSTHQNYYPYPDPEGLHAVGTTTQTWVDHNRLDPYHPEKQRRLLINFFYPTNGPIALEPLDHATLALWKEREMGQRVGSYHDNELAQLENIRRFVAYDSTIAAGKFPLIIFLSGYTMTSGNYFSIIQELVSQGYMVMTIDHPFVAHQVNFPDGQVYKHEALFDDKLYQTCYQDLLFAVHELQNKKSNHLFNHIDFNNIGIMGHSLGGMVTITLMQTPSICKAGIALDSAFTIKAIPGQVGKDFAESNYDGTRGIQKPFLHLLASDHYDVFGYPTTIVPELFDQNYLAVIPETSHNAFTDNAIMKELVPVFKKRAFYLRTGHANGYETNKKICHQVITFFDYFLKNKGNIPW